MELLHETPAPQRSADWNLLEDYRWTYTWDSESKPWRGDDRQNLVLPAGRDEREARVSQNRLIQMVERSGDWQSSSRPPQRQSFSYDSQSRRIRKVVEEQSVISHQPSEIRNYEVVSDRRFLYDGWNLVAEFEMNLQHSSFSLHTSYAWGLDLSGTEQSAGGVGGLLCISRVTENGQRNTSLPTYDGNGNITAYVDVASAHVSQRREYDAFGNSLGMDSLLPDETNAPAFGFSSKYTDAETGLVYYGYRYYSPELGRWTARDPIGEEGGDNLNCMLSNNLIGIIDVLGKSPGFWTGSFGGLGGAIGIGVISAAVTAVACDQLDVGETLFIRTPSTVFLEIGLRAVSIDVIVETKITRRSKIGHRTDCFRCDVENWLIADPQPFI